MPSVPLSRQPDALVPPPGRPILGVDPGLQCTGYAILEATGRPGLRLLEAGVVRLPARAPLEDRLVELEKSLEHLIDAHRPATLVCEGLYAHYKHPRTAILMAHARGVILALGCRRGLQVLSVPSTQVKKLLTGSGHASKTQVQRAIAATLGLLRLPEPHDVADAIAIALAGLQWRRTAALNGRAHPRSVARAGTSGRSPAEVGA